MEITITRGLAELKLLDSRIRKEISTGKFVDVFQERLGTTVYTRMQESDFRKNAKAQFNKINDLIKRRNKIKSEIMKSNATVMVTIAGENMTVADAIEMKRSIEYNNILLTELRKQNLKVKQAIERNEAEIENDINTMYESRLGGKDKNINKDDYDMIASPIRKTNKFKLVDPLMIEDKILDLDETMDNFLSEVDFILSESNSTVKITI